MRMPDRTALRACVFRERARRGAALLRRSVFGPARPEDAAWPGGFLSPGHGLEPGYPERRTQTVLRNGLAVDGTHAPFPAPARPFLGLSLPSAFSWSALPLFCEF